MCKIRVLCTREDDQIRELEFEDYIFGVVASEIGNAPLEACKAQAVAARTTALPYLSNDKVILDKTVQAFRFDRIDEQKYPNAKQGTAFTSGEILAHKGSPLSPCSFSASNGGRTTSSKERWGSYRAWLIEKQDPFDFSVTQGKKTGHGVGMSQEGAKEMARRGFLYKDILSFYYPETEIVKGVVEEMATKTIKASYQVDKFKYMAEEKWKYVAGGATAGEVDCSGAFTYWYKQAGSYMYHGSNSMWRKYSTESGKIGEIELVPGMAVYKIRKWKSDQSGNTWYKTDPGDVYHVGLYIGNNTVVEAKGTKYGVVYSKQGEWSHAGRLKYTEYDLDKEGKETSSNESWPKYGFVSTNSGQLNMRKEPYIGAAILLRLDKGTQIVLTGYKDGWYSVEHDGHIGHVSSEYVTVSEKTPEYRYLMTFTIDNRDTLQELTAILKDFGVTPEIEEVVD